MISHVVLIGPVAVGKSTVGAVLAAILEVPFVDLDEVASPYYAEVDQGIDQLIERSKTYGFVEAHRWWQPARLHAARRVLRAAEPSVIAFGAGHSHFEDEQWSTELGALASDVCVVLLLPALDVDLAVALLRRRCVNDRGEDQDWLYGDVDFIREWVGSEQNRSLANHVVLTDGRTVEEIALDIASRLQK